MTDADFPPWDNDPLSQFLSKAQWNERASAVNLPDIWAVLRRSFGVLDSVMAMIEKDNDPALLPTRFLMVRARGAWLAAVRLGMSAEVVETYPLVRAVIENAWYALHIAKDPAKRAETWLRRREDDVAMARCKAEFTVGNVRRTHASLDAPAATAMQALYDRTIELGGHPNELGVLGAMSRTTTEDAYTFQVAFFAAEPLLIVLALKSAVEAAIGVVKVSRLIFPERFAIMGLDGDTAKLVAEHNAVFKQYVPAKPGA